MAKALAVTPGKCIGCSTCSLTCSITYHNEFNLTKAHISVIKDDFAGVFHLSFASTCKGCKECARVCPTGALRLVETVETNEGGKE